MVGGQRPPLPQGSVSVSARDRQRETETETDRETDRETEREGERDRERKREEGGSQTGSQRVRKREVRRRRVYTLRLEARGHGQLYVALSRSRNQHNVKVRIQPNPLQGALLNDARQFTRNVVFHEVFQL